MGRLDLLGLFSFTGGLSPGVDSSVNLFHCDDWIATGSSEVARVNRGRVTKGLMWWGTQGHMGHDFRFVCKCEYRRCCKNRLGATKIEIKMADQKDPAPSEWFIPEERIKSVLRAGMRAALDPKGPSFDHQQPNIRGGRTGSSPRGSVSDNVHQGSVNAAMVSLEGRIEEEYQKAVEKINKTYDKMADPCAQTCDDLKGTKL